MNIRKINLKLFGKELGSYYFPSLRKIRYFISGFSDTFSVRWYDTSSDDMVHSNDNEVLKELGYYDVLKDGLEVFISIDDFMNDIKDHIPKSITKLDISLEYFMKNIDFFSSFSNLSILFIRDNSLLTKEMLDEISQKTSIKHIFTNNIKLISFEDINEKNLSFISDIAVYKDIVIEEIHRFREKSDKIYIKSFDLDSKRISKLYSLVNVNDKKEVCIRLSNGSVYNISFSDNKIIENIEVKSENVNDVKLFYNYLIKRGYEIKKIELVIINKNYDKLDISSLEEVLLNTNLTIDYGKSELASYEEFNGLVASIKWYREIIDDGNLSPVEKVMYAYDIMKTFYYNESDISKKNSRYPHLIVKTGDIVCVGYSYFLMEILNGIDDNIKVIESGVGCHDKHGNFLDWHSRNLVRLDDDKYNIHGVFVLDVTWDSVKGDGYTSLLKDKNVNDYNALDLYKFFLVPFSNYTDIFPWDTLPKLFQYYYEIIKNEEKVEILKKDISLLLINKGEFRKELKSFFGEEIDDEKIEKYFKVERPSLQAFKEILYNVRLAEGYSEEEAKKEVERVVKVNMAAIEIMKDKEQFDMQFFDDKKGVSKR